MTKKYYLRNNGKIWTAKEMRDIAFFADSNTPTGVIGLKIGRSKAAIYAKAAELGISLKPFNRSPYNRKLR